ncbi:hypothetical protein Tco_0315848 [Tanacetum coccineum]
MDHHLEEILEQQVLGQVVEIQLVVVVKLKGNDKHFEEQMVVDDLFMVGKHVGIVVDDVVLHKLISMVEKNEFDFTLPLIMEHFVKISKKARILELKRRYKKNYVLTSNTPYSSRKIRRIYACSSQETTKNKDLYVVSRRLLYTEFNKGTIYTFRNLEQEFCSSRKLFKTPSIDESSSPEFDLFTDLEEHSEEEVVETMAETMEEYMYKTRGDYGSGVTRPKIDDKYHFELKGQFLKELRDNTFSGSDHKDTNEHIEKFLEIVNLFHIPNITQDRIMLRASPITSRTRSTETSNGLAAIQAQLNNLGREIKKVNEKVYVAQVGCELCKGPHYTKDCPLKEEGKPLEEAYYTQFGVSFLQGGQYRAATPGFHQRNNANPSYQE